MKKARLQVRLGEKAETLLSRAAERPGVTKASIVEAAIVELHPVGRVGKAGILPRAEPQEDDALVMLARFVEQRLDEGEVEAAFLRLQLLPGDRHFDRVGMNAVEHGPGLGQRRGIVAAVVDLPTQHQEGRAVDDQRMAAIFRFQMRHVAARLRQGGGGEKHRSGDQGPGKKHERPFRAGRRGRR